MSVKYKNLLFDFDGCLVSSIDFWIKIYKEALAEFDSYPSDKELMFHIGDWDMWKHFGVTDEAKFVEIVNAKLGDLHDRQVLSENAQEVLEILSPNHKMAVVSSGVKVNILDALTKNEVDHHFQAIIGVGEVENYKPHPEPLHLAIKLLQGQQESSVMIGDSRKDLEAANNAGIASILYYPKEHENTHDLDMLMSYEPTYVVNSLLEIPDIVS